MVSFYNEVISFYVKWGEDAYPDGCLVGLTKPLTLSMLLNWCLATVMSKEGPPAPVQPLCSFSSLAPHPSSTQVDPLSIST